MTEAEIIEKINQKRTQLEEQRSAKAGTAVLQALEAEIETLRASLPSATQTNEEQVFLDECAG